MTDLIGYITEEAPEKSLEIMVRGARRFFSMFVSKATAGSLSVKETFKAAYSKKLIHRAFVLPLLNPMIYWTRVLRDSLELILDFVTVSAEDDKDFEAASFASGCRVRFLKKLKKKLKEAKKLQTLRRKQIDEQREKNLPCVGDRNNAAQRALNDLALIHAKYFDVFKATGKIPPIVRRGKPQPTNPYFFKELEI